MMPMPPVPTQLDLDAYCIPAKLRLLRRKKQLTLSRLAAATGLSTALLSKLETGRMIPTLGTLRTICTVFGVGFGYFFCEPEHHTVSITRKADKASRPKIAHRRANHIALNIPGPTVGLWGEVIELGMNAPLSLCDLDGKTCAFIYVIEGRLQFIAGSMAECLESGDSAFIESRMFIVWSNGGAQTCRFLAIRPGATSFH
jgi:transcriptional regulator with XRE-family HTH domain